MIQLNSKFIMKWCLITFLIVIIGHITGVLMSHGAENIEKGTYFIRDMFYFGHEKSLSALYSAALFIILSCFFRAIGEHEGNFKKQWFLISYIAIFLACDEWFAIHDASLNIYGMGPLNVPVWVWVYGGLSLVLLLMLIPFLKSMPRFLMQSLIISGAVYISGSAIMEVVTYSYTNTNSIFQNIGWFFEDSLEMLGVLIMIMASIIWFKNQGIEEFKFKRWPTIVISLIGLADLIVSYWVAI